MATWNSDGSSTNVQAIHDSLSTLDGDTITIPAGSFLWETTVRTTKGVTIEGAGADSTHITDQGLDAAVGMSCSATRFARITGIEFIKGIAHTYGMVQVGSDDNSGTQEVSFRIDHCKINFPTAGGRGIGVFHNCGLIDHNEFVVSGPGPQQTVTVSGSSEGADGGFSPWTRPLSLGSEKAVFVEDNTFDYTGNDQAEDAIDCYSGARIVIRNNTFLSCTQGFHGTDSGSSRSPVSFEVYNNAYTNDSVHDIRALTVRGGTGVVYGNTYGGSGNWLGVVLLHYRTCVVLNQTGSWGQFCDGTVWQLGSTDLTDEESRQCSLAGGVGFDSATKETLGTWGGSFLRGFDGTGSGGYPGRDQPGIGPGQVSEPIRVWDNDGQEISVYGGGDSGDQTLLEAMIQSGRDYFYSVDDTAARPGYTAYAYPHPLVDPIVPGPAVAIAGVPVY